ncbi:MAG: rod-binding protein [Rhodospirillaceae bacterium]
MDATASMFSTARENLAASRLDQGRQMAAAGKGASRTPDQVREAAQDFESFFLSQMFNHMFSSVKTDALFGGGAGEDAWKSMLVDEYAKATAAKGGIGIAANVMQAMLQAQEASQ